MRRIIIDVDKDYSIDSIKDHLRNCGISCWGGKEINNGDTLVSLDRVCEMLFAMLDTQDIHNYDYVTAPAYDNVVDFVEDFRKTMVKWKNKDYVG